MELFRRDLMPDQNRYWKVSLRTLPARCKPIFDPSRMSRCCADRAAAQQGPAPLLRSHPETDSEQEVAI